MTPKEKAAILIHEMWGYCRTKEDAKQCALIMIEQIETITKHYPPDYMLTVYWKEVRTEIENL